MTSTTERGTQARRAASHDRIVEVASRAVREQGFAGVGVADVMRQAGLTHGGFYAHFASRDDLLVAALERAGRDSAATLERRRLATPQGTSAFRVFVDGYLADALLDATGAGCPVAALCADMPRQAESVRAASAERVRGLVRYVAGLLPPATPAAEASLVAATLVGSLQMARALGNRRAARKMLRDARALLVARYPD